MRRSLKKIILASKSIDRSEMFNRAGIKFETFRTDIEEEKYKLAILDGIKLVKELAKAKALLAKKKLINQKENAIIVAADTIVDLDGKIIGKAQNEVEAFEILKKMMGRTHKLITGMAITEIKTSKLVVDSDITLVEFLELSDKEIRNYIKSNEWKGRAGAYSIRDKASLFIKKINGSSSNVIGLSMHKLYLILKKEFQTDLFLLGENFI